MANLKLDDKFIVNRGSATYKTDFKDIRDNLNLPYELTAFINNNNPGGVDGVEMVKAGKGFASEGIYTDTDPFHAAKIKTTSVDINDGSVVENQYEIYSPGSDYNVDDIITIHPFEEFGALVEIIIEETTPGTLAPTGVYYIEGYGDGTFTNISGLATIENLDIGNGAYRLTYQITERGEYYSLDSNIGNWEDDNGDQNAYNEFRLFKLDVDGITRIYINKSAVKCEIVSVYGTDTDTAPYEAEFKVTSTTEASPDDSVSIILEDASGTQHTLFLIPSDGIRYNDLGDNKIQIVNTGGAGDGGGGGGGGAVTTGVIVNAVSPQKDSGYTIVNGSLWYNTTNGRLYVNTPVYKIDENDNVIVTDNWIDASPSALNDIVKKTVVDPTKPQELNDNYDITSAGRNAMLYADNYAIHRLPLITDAT